MAGKGERNRGSAVWVEARKCWQIRFYSADGKRLSALQKDLNENTEAHKAAALQRVDEIRASVIAGGLVVAKVETLGEYIQRWLEYRRAKGEALAHKERATALLASMFAYIPASKLTSDNLRDFVARLDKEVQDGRLRWTTAKQRWGAVRAMCGDMASSKSNAIRVQGFSNVARDVKGPDRGTERRKSYISPREWSAILASELEPETKALLAFSLFTGCRRQEIFGLRWDSVNTNEGVITVHETRDLLTNEPRPTKTAKSRDIPIHPNLVPLLEALRALPGPYVIPLSWKWRWSPSVLQRALRLAGITTKSLVKDSDTTRRLRWHDMRGSYATWLLVSGTPIHVVQARLGHSSLDQTQEYLRVAEVIDKARFGEVFAPLTGDALALEPKPSRFRIRRSGGGNGSGNSVRGNLRASEKTLHQRLLAVPPELKIGEVQVPVKSQDTARDGSGILSIPSTPHPVVDNGRTEDPKGLSLGASEIAIVTSDESVSPSESLEDLKQRLDAAVRENRWADVARFASRIDQLQSK